MCSQVSDWSDILPPHLPFPPTLHILIYCTRKPSVFYAYSCIVTSVPLGFYFLMFLGCFPRTLFLLLQQLIMFLRWHHNGRRKFMFPLNMLPWACFPIPPIVRHLTLPPASWYTPWCGDFHQGLLWNLYNLVRVSECVCAQTICFSQGNRSSFSFCSHTSEAEHRSSPSFAWCLNWIPHEILRMNENGGISLSLTFFLTLQWPWLLCVTNQSSQKIKPVAVAKECISEAYKWRHTLQVQKQRACVKTSAAKIWHSHSRAYWCSGYNVPHFTVSRSATTPLT